MDISSSIRKEFLERRFRAHKNLMLMCQYHSIPLNQIERFTFANVEDYARGFGETSNLETRTAILAGDASYMEFIKPNGVRLIILYVDANTNSGNLNSESITSRMRKFLTDDMSFKYSEDQLNSPMQTVMGSSLDGTQRYDTNLQMILYSEKELLGAPFNLISRYNEYALYPTKHFTINMLLINPVKHKASPKSTRKLSPAEVQDFISKQIGLKFTSDGTTLGQEYLERIEEAETEVEKASIRAELNEAMLSKLPTINSNDPIVLWQDFRYRDVLMFIRRVDGDMYLRRVIYPVDIKVSKGKQAKSKLNK
jgi:hypothetical protein